MHAASTQSLTETREALSASEARLRAVVASIDEGYCQCEIVLDGTGRPVDYRFLETNELFETATGLHAAVGRTALELVPELESEWITTYGKVALGDEPLRFEMDSEAMGRRFDVFATPVPPHGRFALIFSDITEQHAASIALAESEQRFRNLADHAPVMIWMTDADGSCTYLNRQWYDFTGQTEEEALGYGWLSATHPDDRQRAAAVFRDAVVDRVPLSLDHRLRRHDGDYRWAVDTAAPRFTDDGRFLGFVGSVLDIAERKEIERVLTVQRDREHDIAVRLQRAMLPAAPVEDDRVEIATKYVPSADHLQVGGDWHETFRTHDGRIGALVGDVVGHNIEAAAAMGQLRAGCLALSAHAESPGELLDALDEFAQRNRITDFATALCVFVDPDSGEVEYSSAGHLPSTILDPDGVPTWLDGARSVPLGTGISTSRTSATTELGDGDLFMAYSDGLVERRGEVIDVGLERLADLLGPNVGRPLEQICSTTIDALDDGTGFDDDVVIVALRRRS